MKYSTHEKTSFDSVQDVQRYLNSIPMFATAGTAAASWGLQGINGLCEQLGNPHRQLKVIHIAGTNGKGTVAHYISQVLQKSGYSVGLYTSPHLHKVNERWVVNDIPMSDDSLTRIFQQYGNAIEQAEPTFFELTTAIAFRYFADQKVDFAVVETGLGGRLDATNIVDPIMTIITSIGLDHQAVLGDTLEEIAAEKAGIIKNKRPVIIGDITGDPKNVIKHVAHDKGAAVVETRFHDRNKGEAKLGNELDPGIYIAKVAIKYLSGLYSIKMAPVKDLLNEARSTLKGRFERLHPQYSWYFDGAHNTAAVELLKKKLETIGSVSYATVVLSVMKDKADKDFLSLFSDFRKIYYHPLQFERAAALHEIAPLTDQSVERFPHQPHSRDRLLKSLKSELVIFTGSFYFYTCVKDWMRSF